MKRFLLFTLCIAQYAYSAHLVLEKNNKPETQTIKSSIAPLRKRRLPNSRPPITQALKLLNPRVPSIAPSLISPSASSSTDIVTPTPTPTLRAVDEALRNFDNKKETYKAMCNYLTFLENNQNPDQIAIAEAKRTKEKITKELKNAQITLKNARTEQRIAREFLPNTKEYCDLIHAELLIAQEIAQQKLQGPDSSIVQTTITEIATEFNTSKQTYSPTEYYLETQREHEKAVAELHDHQIKKNKILTDIRLLSQTGLISLDNAAKQTQQATAAYAQAEQAVRTKAQELDRATQYFNSRAQTSNPLENRQPFQSLFHTQAAPGTATAKRQALVKFLGAFKLRLRLQNKINTAANERLTRWFRTSDLDAQIDGLNQFLKLLDDAILQAKFNVKRNKLITEPENPPFNSLFLQETTNLQNIIKEFIHPLFHKHGEPLPENTWQIFTNVICKSLQQIKNNQKEDAFYTLKHAFDDNGISKVALTTLTTAIPAYICKTHGAAQASLASKIVDRLTRLYPMHIPEKNRQGACSDQAFLDIKAGKQPVATSWNEKKECPGGIERCPLLGVNSKAILEAMNQFIHRIQLYEQKNQQPYFIDKQDVHRIMDILSAALENIYETNIRHALNNTSCEDQSLRNSRAIIEFLAALPTSFYNVVPKALENREAIDKLLACYPLNEKKLFYDWIRSLVAAAETSDFAHNRNLTGITLVLEGPTGVGKTYLTNELCQLLGIIKISMSLQELIESNTKCRSAAELLKSGHLSPLEKHLAALPKSTSSLLIVIHIDEANAENGLNLSDAKKQLCQFLNILLPSLHIHLPTKQFNLLTCNDASFIHTDEALSSRCYIIRHEKLTVEATIERLLPKVVDFFNKNPLLKNKYSEDELRKITQDYVTFDPTVNMRLLESRLSRLVDHFTTKDKISSGREYLFPPEMRNGQTESFQECLTRIFPKKSFSRKTEKKAFSSKNKRTFSGKKTSKPYSSSMDKPTSTKEKQQYKHQLADEEFNFSESSSSDTNYDSPSEDDTSYDPSSSCSEDNSDDPDTE